MVSVLTIYGTGEGQTAKVAERITDVLEARGHEVDAWNVEEVPSDLSIDDYEAVLVGASIHAGKHQPTVEEFVSDNREILLARPTGFFQLSLSSAVSDESRRAEAAGYVDAFLEETGWNPDRIALFGGALRFSKYGFLKRLMMKQIAKKATGDTDTGRDYEYTDWEEVEAFAADFASFVEGRVGIPSPIESGDDSH